MGRPKTPYPAELLKNKLPVEKNENKDNKGNDTSDNTKPLIQENKEESALPEIKDNKVDSNPITPTQEQKKRGRKTSEKKDPTPESSSKKKISPEKTSSTKKPKKSPSEKKSNKKEKKPPTPYSKRKLSIDSEQDLKVQKKTKKESPKSDTKKPIAEISKDNILTTPPKKPKYKLLIDKTPQSSAKKGDSNSKNEPVRISGHAFLEKKCVLKEAEPSQVKIEEIKTDEETKNYLSQILFKVEWPPKDSPRKEPIYCSYSIMREKHPNLVLDYLEYCMKSYPRKKNKVNE